MEKVRSIDDLSEDEIEEEVEDIDDVEVDLAYLECLKEEAIEAATKLLVPLNELDKQIDSFYENCKVKLQRNKVALDSILSYNPSEHPEQRHTKHDKQPQSYARFVKRECECFENSIKTMDRLRVQIIKTRKHIKAIDIDVLEEHNGGLGNDQNDDMKVIDKKLQSILLSSDEVKDRDQFCGRVSFKQSSSSFINTRSRKSSEYVSVSSTHAGARAKTSSNVILYEPLNDSLQTTPRSTGSSSSPMEKDSYISLPPTTDQKHTAYQMLEPEISNISQIDVHGIHKQMRKSRETCLVNREENIKHFQELRKEIASPSLALFGNVQPLGRKDSVKARFGNVDVGVGSGYTNDSRNMVICKRYNLTDRNWIDVKLFPQYYLVVIQKKEAKAGNNEFLNKYNKRTGELMAWLWLPGAGRMCKN